jgi:cytochrome c oxidase subunit 2
MEPRRKLEDWHHMLAMCLIMAAVAGGLGYLFLKVDFIPQPASAERSLIDSFMQVLFAIAGVFFAIIVTVFGYALIFFRRRKGDDTDARPIRGNALLEIAWTVIPLIIVIVLSVHAAGVLDKMTASGPGGEVSQSVFSLGVFVPAAFTVSPANAPAPEITVNITASRFIWQFAYPDYSINNTYELVVPVDHRLVLDVHSKDVIHSFWVQQWGPKQDAVPGLSPVLRITPTQIGQYTIQCSQLCGHGHTDMTAPVRVVSDTDFVTWVRQQQAASNVAAPPANTHVMFDLTALNIAFDTGTITVPAGVEVMINFDNKDNGIPHNFAVYTDSSATKAIFVGQIVTGPKIITYTFTAPQTPGSYFFRCDVHPTIMTGTFIVK